MSPQPQWSQALHSIALGLQTQCLPLGICYSHESANDSSMDPVHAFIMRWTIQFAIFACLCAKGFIGCGWTLKNEFKVCFSRQDHASKHCWCPASGSPLHDAGCHSKIRDLGDWTARVRENDLSGQLS